jgi:hypothetical protein
VPLGPSHYEQNARQIADCLYIGFRPFSKPSDVNDALAILRPNIDTQSIINGLPILVTSTWMIAERYIGISLRQLGDRVAPLSPAFPERPLELEP